MDPSIVKFFEDDEDESMHSGADVEAFSAALTRDIGGDPHSHSLQHPDHEVGMNYQGSGSASQQLFEQWKASDQDENVGQGSMSAATHLLEQWKACSEDANAGQQMQQKEGQHLQPLEQHLSRTEQAKQNLGFNEKVQLTESQLESSQHISQEGHCQSDTQLSTERNPSPTVEKDEINITDKISAHPHKQERAQSSMSQHPYSSVQLNVQQSMASNEANNRHSLQQFNVQEPEASNDAINSARRVKPMPTIPFHMLIPILRPNLDKDRSMQLQAIFSKLRTNEVSKEDFLRVIRNIVGDQMLRQAAQKLQIQLQTQASRNPQTNPNLSSLQNQKGNKSPPDQPQVPASSFQRQTDSSFPTMENSIQKSRELDNKSDGKAMHAAQTRSGLTAVNQERENAMIPLQSVNKQPQHSQVPQSSFPTYGMTPTNFNSHPYPRPLIGAHATSQKSQGQDLQTRQALHAQGIAATQLGSSQLMGMAHMAKYDIQNSSSDPKRIHGGSLPGHLLSQQNPVTVQTYPNNERRSIAMPSTSLVKPEVVDQASEPLVKPQLTVPESSSYGISKIEQKEQQPSRMVLSNPMTTTTNTDGSMQISSATPLHVSGTTTKTPQKKTSAGQKKPLEAPGTSPPPPSKKQKTSGLLHDQSIDQLNDVTAVSGVNLREEEEQLFSAPKEESRASEASRRVVQEEEERLILQRGPLQKKLAEITLKCGLKSIISSDVERCLSMCVEERLRGLVSYLIKLSKQRVDSEKARHRFVVTSDVGRQILSINKKIKDDWDKKQAEEAEKLRKSNDVEGNTGGEIEDREKDKEKDEGRLKATKINKDEDDKMRTTAANVAARAAVGGDDMLSKWQLMAEQARQKREGLDGASSSQTTKNINSKSSSTFRSLEQEESEKKGSAAHFSGSTRKASRTQAGITHIRVSPSISLKDVISALEREPQMSKSTLIYRLYERKAGVSAVEQLGSL